MSALAERSKYERMWDVPDYRINSPGEQMLMPWLKIVKPKPHASITDFGCGCGRASMVLGLMGFRVLMVDIAANSLDPDVRGLVEAGQMEFRSMDFTELGQLLPKADHGYCCDVMEHMPPDRVDAAIAQIVDRAGDSFFLINFREDDFGNQIGEELHLTIKPFAWWRDKLREHGDVVDARDLIGKGIFRVARR